MFGFFKRCFSAKNGEAKKLTGLQVAKIEKIQQELNKRRDVLNRQGYDVSYVVSREGRSVSCIVHKVGSKQQADIGHAFCSSEDRFVTPVGQIIALCRATGKKVPNDYLHF